MPDLPHQGSDVAQDIHPAWASSPVKRVVEFRMSWTTGTDWLNVCTLYHALGRRRWRDWQPRLRVLACAAEGRKMPEIPRGWANILTIDPVLPTVDSESGLAMLAPAPDDVEVVACIEVPFLLTADLDRVLERVLDRVADEALIAGVVADQAVPLQEGETTRQAWQRIAGDLCPPPRMTHACPLLDPALPLALRTTPFAPDTGVVFVAAAALGAISRHYAELSPGLVRRLSEPRMRHQVALALAVAQAGTATWALPTGYATPDGNANVRVVLTAATPADPLSRETYRTAVAAHARQVAASLASLRQSIKNATGDGRVAELETMQAIIASGLFDPVYYLTEHPDLAGRAIDPLQHYVALGEYQGRWPNPCFNPEFYRNRHLGGDTSFNALRHYIEAGERCGLATQLFNPARYLERYPALAAFVDRPLFHFLTIGRDHGLTGGPSDEAARHLAHFQRTKDVSPGALMRYKQALVREFGVGDGFAVLGETLTLKDSDRIVLKPLLSQRDYARARRADYVETDPGGERVAIQPMDVVGEGSRPPARVTSRSAYVACVGEATVRGHSAFIDVGDAVLFDFEGEELARFDSEFEFDHAIFHATPRGPAWVLEAEDTHHVQVLESAFSLLSARSHAFGHWIWESLPKFVAARLSGGLPPMPILIDADMSPSHRQSLEWMLRPGDEIVEVPNFATLHVRQLWCAPTLHFSTVFEKRNTRLNWEYLMHSPARSAPVMAEMGRRADLAVGAPPVGHPERVYLARRIHRHAHHILCNHAQIEALARSRGFSICYPEDLTFAEQVHLVRGARFVLAPTGSAVFLGVFARPGMRLCLLDDARTIAFELFQSLFGGVGVATTVFTGPVVAEHELYYEWADYEIDAGALELFLDHWLDQDAA